MNLLLKPFYRIDFLIRFRHWCYDRYIDFVCWQYIRCAHRLIELLKKGNDKYTQIEILLLWVKYGYWEKKYESAYFFGFEHIPLQFWGEAIDKGKRYPDTFRNWKPMTVQITDKGREYAKSK